MQLSPRAARNSRVEAAETVEPGGKKSADRAWFRGFGWLFRQKGQPKGADANANALLAFPSEAIPRPEPARIAEATKRITPKVAKPSPTQIRAMLIVGGVVVLAGLGALVVQRYPILQMMANEPRPGNLTINTRPGDSEILIDGVRRGTTPLTLPLTPGTHTITIRSGSDERVVPLTIASGAEVSQYFEMKVAEPAVLVGRVSVVTDPPGARVAVDGKARGTSPITVVDLTPVDHKVSVTSDTGSAERTVAVTAGGTASVMFSLPKVSGPVGGWLAISAPFDVEVVERDDVIGTSGTSRIMLAAGRHDITVMNRSLGYEEPRRVEVTAGKTVAVRVDPPKVSVSVNARPWADVTLDGNSVGQTPISNLIVTVGTHDLVFRHPQFAERRQTVVVTAKGPNRIAADLTK
jgi:PEGA domain